MADAAKPNIRGKWLNLFPSEMELGDVFGEKGALVVACPAMAEFAWTLVFSPSEPERMREPTVEHHNCTVLDHWPEQAPLRIFRPEMEQSDA